MFLSQLVRGLPSGCLQFSGGGLKMAWLASVFSSICARCPKKVRRQDLMMDESGGWLVMRRMPACQQWATAPSPSQHRAPGTVCQTRSVAAHLWLSSNVHSKFTFICSVFINIVFNYFSPRAVDIVQCP